VPAVNLLLSSELQKSAAAELRKCRPGGVVNRDDIYADADAAFSALSTVLGGDEWFFGAEEPGLFDATVFGYTHLILTLEWHEKETAIARSVRKHKNLVAHERRAREFCGW
jgi:metaxin